MNVKCLAYQSTMWSSINTGGLVVAGGVLSIS